MPDNENAMQPKLVTIGVYGFDKQSFFQALLDAHVDTFCDIRLRRSMRGSAYTFANSARLQEQLQQLGIRYMHVKNLAPTQAIRDQQKAEDRQTKQAKRTRTTLGQTFIQALPRIHPWHGGLDQLFDGCLCLQGTGGYISATGSIPHCSTGYWLPDRSLSLSKPLIPDAQHNKLYYDMLRIGDGRRATMLSIKYVGFAEPVQQIPAGTLVRVSLARWFKPTPTTEERCYLQLSGWYL